MFTDEELMNAQLSKTTFEDTYDWEEQLIADDMSGPSVDNKLLEKNKHTQAMTLANQSIAAGINRKSLASDLAHQTEEIWWGID